MKCPLKLQYLLILKINFLPVKVVKEIFIAGSYLNTGETRVEFRRQQRESIWFLLGRVCKSIWALLHLVCVKLLTGYESNWILADKFGASLCESRLSDSRWNSSPGKPSLTTTNTSINTLYKHFNIMSYSCLELLPILVKTIANKNFEHQTRTTWITSNQIIPFWKISCPNRHQHIMKMSSN